MRTPVVGAVLLLALAASWTAAAQPSQPTVYGEIGYASLGAHDSEQGKAPLFGGEMTFRVVGPLHAGVEVSTASRHPTRFGSNFRQTALLISGLAEWPRGSRVRALAGGGIGWFFQRTDRVAIGPEPEGAFRYSDTDTVAAYHGRGGVVVDLADQVVLRVDGLLAIGAGLDWVAGGRASVGYAF